MLATSKLRHKHGRMPRTVVSSQINMRELILSLYQATEPPLSVTERPVTDPDGRDALWFQGTSWTEIDLKDWNSHSGAFSSFTAPAFRYYYPSILMCGANFPSQWTCSVDGLLQMLNLGPEISNWPQFTADRILGWKKSEYGLLISWILFLADFGGEMWADQLERPFETAGMLETLGH
jgi:hypothetical protein